MDDDILTIDPLRDLAWRYDQARALECAGKLSSPRHDPAVRRALEYLRQRRKGTRRYGDELAYIHAAHVIWVDDACDAKYAIEAYLMASVTSDEVATDLGVSPACIDWYCALFFDLSDRLSSRAYVDQLLARLEATNPDPRDSGWKRLAYSHGHGALKKEIDRRDATSQMAWVMDRLRCRAARRVLDEVQTPSIKDLIKLLHTLDGRGRATGQAMETPDITENIQAMLEMMPFRVGPDPDPDSPTKVYDDAGIELHSDEELLLHAGFRLPHLDSLLAATEDFRADKRSRPPESTSAP
jgi:hypothetical protein